jgi:hypothetical protein
MGQENKYANHQGRRGKDKVVRAFESVAWFKDEFGILRKKDQGKKHAPPDALYNLGSNKSYKTIHDHHKWPKEPVGTPPCTHKITKKVIGLEDSDKDEASKEEDSKAPESNGREEDNDKNTRDSTSQTSINRTMGDDSGSKKFALQGLQGH